MGDLCKKAWEEIKEGKATWESSSGENLEYQTEYNPSLWDKQNIQHGIYGPLIHPEEPMLNSFEILKNENEIKQEVKDHLDTLKELKYSIAEIITKLDEEILKFEENFKNLI